MLWAFANFMQGVLIARKEGQLFVVAFVYNFFRRQDWLSKIMQSWEH